MILFFKIFKTMKIFILSMILVILIAIGLSYLPTNSLGGSNITSLILFHKWLFFIIRCLIVIGFILIWPLLVKSWAKKYRWNDTFTRSMIQRRWRFAIWLILIDLLFEIV